MVCIKKERKKDVKCKKERKKEKRKKERIKGLCYKKWWK